MVKKKVKKRFGFKNEYLQSWKFIKESKNFLYFILVGFFVSALFGFFVPASEAMQEQIKQFIMELLEQTVGLSAFGLTKFIFLNNLNSSFLGMIGGIILGIFPVFVCIANGYLLGFVGNMAVAQDGFLTLWKLFPHGIFELPAVFISLALGMKIGTFILQKNKWISLKEYLWNSMRVFIFVVIPLLVVAAFIEGYLFYFLN